MSERRDELVRIDATGAVHPVGRQASRDLRQRQGSFRLMPSPPDVVILRQEGLEEPDDSQKGVWLCGEIRKAGTIWDLMAMIGQGGWRGELVVINVKDSTRRNIFFDRGAVIGASSTAERERLGAILYHYGVLSEEQISQVAAASTAQVRFGEAAVALGFITAERLYEMLATQTKEILYAVMVISGGAFYFQESFDESMLPRRLNLPMQSLLMEGVQRMDEMELFVARIPSSLHVPVRVLAKKPPEGHEHAAVYEAIDDARSVEDIARHLGRGLFETTKALFQLMQARVINIHPPRPTGAEAIVAIFNEAIALIISEVDKRVGGDEIRQQLASFATASGVYDALFRGAGPAKDGTLEPAKIVATAKVLLGADGATTMLAQWLYEYASFAMFIAEPIIRSDASKGADIAEVSRKVTELLTPLSSSDV